MDKQVMQVDTPKKVIYEETDIMIIELSLVSQPQVMPISHTQVI